MKATAEIIDIDDARPHSSGSGGGFDHFPGMKIGTVFSVSPNYEKSSLLNDYVLLSKQGVTVLLGMYDDNQKQVTRRHIGQKFWQQNTMVQILHIPEEKKEQENGTSA